MYVVGGDDELAKPVTRTIEIMQCLFHQFVYFANRQQAAARALIEPEFDIPRKPLEVFAILFRGPRFRVVMEPTIAVSAPLAQFLGWQRIG